MGAGTTTSVLNSIVIELSHSRTEVPKRKQSLHRLSVGVPFADVKPPKGVEVIGLDAVYVHLDVTRSSRGYSKRRRIKRCSDAPGSIFVPEDLPPEGQHDSFFRPEEETRALDEIHLARGLVSEQVGHLYSLSSSVFSHHDPRLLDVPSASSLPYSPDTRNTTSQPANHMPIAGIHISGKRALDAPAAEWRRDGINPEDIINLVDAALRMAICDRPMKVAPGIKTASETSVSKLATTAPALWSPEYLPVSWYLFSFPTTLER